MKYLFLLYGDPAQEPTDPDAMQAEIATYSAYDKLLADAGVMLPSHALQGTETATTVQAPEQGEPTITDGPFAETREILGGYYLVDVPDLDAAIGWATRCPAAKRGKVEIRPVLEFEQP
ncbi:YciI family protein [Salinispora tropica]|uniref:DGPFAETKE family protein n=1 Tax=Salinispora tropica (strain ATCC BAA-916 / DSM 44818 / JCM 13857 / NBRC 105044 / CNB-440) TaxID=369723 RepID=A4X7B2_SALTO|nr:YciI family protein [Salinispora tropica]ABP54762.1 DGPFAETKE family protein [Salinispora tropica CNB-440]